MTGRARLWIVTRKHPPAIGGMEELSFRVAQQLARRRPLTLLKWGGGQAWLPFFFAWAALRVLAALVARRVTLLLLGDPVLSVLGAIARPFGVPVLCVVHGLDVTWRNAAYQAYLRALFWGRMDAYVCISESTAGVVRARAVGEDRVFVVPVGVVVRAPPAAHGEAGGGPRLVFVGRLVPRKGAAWFVREVLPALVRTFPSLRLTIVGEGPERGAIERAARERGVFGSIAFAGAASDEVKWSLLAECDAVVVPNVPVVGDVEGFGIVAIEAGASGKPVFAADLEGLREAVADGVSGWRLPPGDAKAWTHAMIGRLDDRAALAAQGAVAREHVARHFDWDAIGERYAEIVARFAPA
jgi:phosphatidylinositol alpha-1,6-mannosyltransferase